MQDMDAADPFAPPTAPVLPTQIRKASSTQMSMAMFVTKRAPVPEPSAEEYEATQLKNDALQEEQKEFRHAVAKREEELRNAWALHKGGRAGKEVGVFGRKTKEETWATKLETMLLAEAQRVGEDLPPRPPMPDRFMVRQPPTTTPQPPSSLAPQPPSQPQDPQPQAPQPPSPPEAPAPQPPAKKCSKEFRGPAIRDFFFTLRDIYKWPTKQQGCDWVSIHLGSIFGVSPEHPLNESVVRAWERQRAKEKEQRASGPPPEKQKPGPKKRTLSTGELLIAPKLNTKVPHAVLLYVASVVTAQWRAGVPLSLPLIRPLVQGALEVKGHGSWRPSNWWLRDFLKKLGLSWRATTKAANAKPDNFEELHRNVKLRLVFLSVMKNIPLELIITADETGLSLLPIAKRTYGEKGAKQVAVLGQGDKREFTMLVAIHAGLGLAGKVQSIWAGKTDRCEPEPEIQQKYKDKIRFTHSASHWTTKATVKKFLCDLWNDYVEPTMNRLALDPETQSWIMYWDVYSVHRDESVLAWAKQQFPNLVFLFVPARCTGDLSPLDVSWNFPFKAYIVWMCSATIAKIVREQLDKGKQPEEVQLNVSLSYLRPLFCGWMYESLKNIETNKPKAFKDGWSKPGYLECLTNLTVRADLLREALELNGAGKLFPKRVGAAPSDWLSFGGDDHEEPPAIAPPPPGEVEIVPPPHPDDEAPVFEDCLGAMEEQIPTGDPLEGEEDTTSGTLALVAEANGPDGFFSKQVVESVSSRGRKRKSRDMLNL